MCFDNSGGSVGARSPNKRTLSDAEDVDAHKQRSSERYRCTSTETPSSQKTARRTNLPRRPPAQEGRRNPAAEPPLSTRGVASQRRAVSPRDRCRSTLHYDMRCYCEHALTPTQTNTKTLGCCANQIAVAGRPQTNRRKRIRTQVLELSQLALAETHLSHPFFSARCVPRDRIVAADSG